MAEDWPLVGRKAERQRLRGILDGGGRGAVLAGPPGVGKTRLAADCLHQATEHGFRPLRVSATQAAAGLPFGAFAALMPDLHPATGQTDMLRQVARAITELRDERGVALFIDDAHLLDKASAALAHQLAAQGTVFVLATVRSAEPSPDAVMALWKDGILERLDLLPFDDGDVEAFVTAIVGGPIDRAALHFFTQRTQGNALFLRELVLAALNSGALRDDAGVWRLHARVPASDRLMELLDARLGELADPERDGLAALAIGEPLGVPVFCAVTGHASVDALEARHLIRVESEGRRLQIRLAHPLYGDLLRSRLSPLKARTICCKLAEGTERLGARRREDALRVATWQLEGGGPQKGDLLLVAARQARARWDLSLAERLARAAIEAGSVFPATLLLGQLLWMQGHGREAEDTLASLTAVAADDAERAQLASARMDNFVLGLGRLDEAVRVGEEAQVLLSEVRWVDAVAGHRARLAQLFGQMRAAITVLEPILERAEGTTLVDACLTAGSAYASMGKVSAAIAVTERGFAVHSALERAPMLGPHLHRHIQSRALTCAGLLDEAEALARASYAQAVADEGYEAQGMCAMSLARILIHRGAVAQAERIAREGVGSLRDRGSPFVLRLGLMPLAHALALLGRAVDARAILREVDALGIPPYALFGPELLQVRAWTEVAAGDVPAAHAFLREAVAMSEDGGELVFRGGALHDLARLGSPREARPGLEELAKQVEGPLAAARAAHVAALVDRDAEALELAADSFERMGANLLAAEAAADAAASWRKAQDPRRAAAVERRMNVLADRCEGAQTPALATTGQARVALTARELEIARLAAEGVPNREIAARLFLSLATVQNKLHATYEKLGVEGRATLKEALERH